MLTRSVGTVVIAPIIVFAASLSLDVLASAPPVAPALPTASVSQKPRVTILATGGTIAGASKSPTDPGYRAGAVAVDTLLEAVPQLSTIARVTGEQIASIGSQDMNDAIWLKLAKRINEIFRKDEADAVVITHGTDTMEETAYFLNLAVRSDRPVVMTGSMRPSTALSADGPANIYDAVAAASNPGAVGKGVLVVLNDDIHGAKGVTKAHTTDIQTFTSGETGLVGVTLAGSPEFTRTPTERHTSASEFDLTGIEALPRVDILYASAGMSSDLIDAAVERGAKGLVIAGVGDGNMTSDAIESLKRARAAGVVVVRSSRVGEGLVRRNIEVNDDALGFVAAIGNNPSKSRVLLKLLLLTTNDVNDIQRAFDQY